MRCSPIGHRNRSTLNAPRTAWVWDYFLGGSHNFTVDWQVADAAITMKPDGSRSGCGCAAVGRRSLSRSPV